MTIGIQAKAQAMVQKALSNKQKQEAASTAATQSGSTNTPTTTTTPKVTPTPKVKSTPKAVASTQQTAITPISQTISNIKQSTSTQTPQTNLFASQKPTAQTATQDLLSRREETKEVKNTTIPTNVVKTALNIGGTVAETVTKTLYNQGMDYINTKIGQAKDTISTVKTTSKATKTALDLFNPVEEYRKQRGLTLNQLGQDIKTEWDSGEGIGMVRDTIANTIEGLPRGITRAEYGIAELIDWGVDAEWATKLKNSVESDLDYWENTRVYKRVKEAESFRDVLKNPLMYAGGTLGEMLPMFISAWVAIPTTFAQVYGETYRDYASDESLQAAGLTDNQIRLMSLGVAGVNTLIELGSDLVEGIMPWTRPAVKGAEKEVRRTLTKPFMNIFKNVVKGGTSEGFEEVLQNEIQNQVASYNGSDRDLPTWTDRLTTFGISSVIGGILQGGNIMVEINRHKELKQAFDEWSEAVDDIAPGVSEEEKEKLFSAIVAAEIQDANMSDKQVTKYENESAALYNEKAKLTEELNTTTDKTKQQEINRKIEDIDARIKNIDEIINRGQAVMEEVNKKLEELSQKQAIQAPYQTSTKMEGGENLSEQTMQKGMMSVSSQPTIRKINAQLRNSADEKETKKLQDQKNKILKPYMDNIQEWIDKPISEYSDEDLYAMEEVIFADNKITKDRYDKAKEIGQEIEDRQGFVDEMTIRELEDEAEVESGKRKDALEKEIKDRKYNAKLSFMKDMSADVKSMSDDKLELFADELFDRILSKKMLNDTLLVKKYQEVSNELRLRGLAKGKDGLHTAGVYSLVPGADINEIISVAIDEFAAGSLAVQRLDGAIKDVQKNITKSKWYNKISLMSKSIIDELYSYQNAKNERASDVLDLLKKRRDSLFNNMRNKVLSTPSIMRGILSNQLGTYYGQTASNDLINLFSARGVTIRSTFYDKDGSIKPMTQEEAQQWSKTISDICKILGINLDKLYRDTSVVINSHNKQELPSSDSSFKTLGLFKPYNEYSRAIAFSTERDDNSLVHEIIHSIELKLLLDAGFEYDSNLGWVSDENGHILSDEQIKLLLDNINRGGGDLNYWERPAELFARIGEQYFAEKVGDTRYRNEPWYWNKDFFDSTIKPMVEDILKNSGYQYEQGENIEADILYNLGLLNKDLKDIESRAIERKISTNEVAAELNNLQSRYDEIDNMVDSMPEGNEKDEMMLEMSSLSENIRLLSQGGEEYLDRQRNTKKQQIQMDNGVNDIADNGTYLMSEVENNQQDGEIVDDAMKEEIEENKEPDTTGPLDVAVAKTVDKVINSANKVINKDVKEKPVNEQKKAKDKKNSIREVGQGIKDVFTPALSRLYSISPRLAGAVHVYEASVGLKTLGYKRLSEDFVKELDKLRKKNPDAYKKLSLALFDWGMDESIDIKQSLKDAGLDEKLFEPVVSVLNQIATEYQSAGLDITINDKYFPRKVKDYGLLLDYLSRKSGTNIKDTRGTILKQIDDINSDPNLSDGEKERRVHNLLINNFTKPSERSNNAKERKLVLSERLLTDEERSQGYVNDITDFYEEPIVALSNYIDDMVKKTELKKMLGGLTNDKTAISEKFDDSIAKIMLDMEYRGELTKEKAEEAKKVIKSIVNARDTGKGAQRIKNLTYSMTIANWLSAAQQLEDLSKTLLRGPSGLKNIVKSVVGKANIGMDDTGIDNIFAELEGGKNITDLLFKLSGFDAVDALGKKSFLNTAWDSCVKQANSDKRSIILKTRLIQMYGEEMGNSIFESYKSGELRDKNKQPKLDVMIDLMYQLGNTQPIYKSAMPTAYLNNPKIRVVYCLWSFTLKQVDRVIQGTKQVYNNQILLGKSKAIATTVATLRCTGALIVVSIISALVQELINWAKGDEDDLMFKKWREEGFGAFLKQFGINSLSGLLKIFNISKYDKYIFDREGLDAVFINKITPAWLNIPGDIIQVLVGKDKVSEIGKYMPLFLKPLYYQFKNRDMLPDFKLWGGETEEIGEPTGSRSGSKKTSDRPTTSRSGGTKTTDRPTGSRSGN